MPQFERSQASLNTFGGEMFGQRHNFVSAASPIRRVLRSATAFAIRAAQSDTAAPKIIAACKASVADHKEVLYVIARFTGGNPFCHRILPRLPAFVGSE